MYNPAHEFANALFGHSTTNFNVSINKKENENNPMIIPYGTRWIANEVAKEYSCNANVKNATVIDGQTGEILAIFENGTAVYVSE